MSTPTLNQPENVKGFLSLLDYYSYGMFLEGSLEGYSSPFELKDTRDSVKEKGYTPTARSLLQRINNSRDQKRIINKLGLGKISTIEPSHVFNAFLPNYSGKKDLVAAFKKIKSLPLHNRTKKALRDLLRILVHLHTRIKLSSGSPLPLEYRNMFTQQGATPTLRALHKKITGNANDRKAMASRLNIKEVSFPVLAKQVLNKPADDSDLSAALCKIDTNECPKKEVKPPVEYVAYLRRHNPLKGTKLNTRKNLELLALALYQKGYPANPANTLVHIEYIKGSGGWHYTNLTLNGRYQTSSHRTDLQESFVNLINEMERYDFIDQNKFKGMLAKVKKIMPKALNTPVHCAWLARTLIDQGYSKETKIKIRLTKRGELYDVQFLISDKKMPKATSSSSQRAFISALDNLPRQGQLGKPTVSVLIGKHKKNFDLAYIRAFKNLPKLFVRFSVKFWLSKEGKITGEIEIKNASPSPQEDREVKKFIRGIKVMLRRIDFNKSRFDPDRPVEYDFFFKGN